MDSIPFEPIDVMEKVIDLISIQVKAKQQNLGFFVHDSVPEKVKYIL